MKKLLHIVATTLIILAMLPGVGSVCSEVCRAQGCEYHFYHLLEAQNSHGETISYQIIELGSPIVWVAPNEPGTYTLRVGIGDGCGTVVWSSTLTVIVEKPTPTPTPTQALTLTPTATPTPTLTPTPTPTPTPTSTQASTLTVTPIPSPDAMVELGPLNLREGPGTIYPPIGKLKEGAELELRGRNTQGSWLKVETELGEGWVSAKYVQLNVELASVEVVPAPPTLTPRVEGQAVVWEAGLASSRAGSSFDYGIQVHGTEGDPSVTISLVQGLGFHWIKQQVRWEHVEPQRSQYSWGTLDALVNTANAGGIKVLFSVVAAPLWARTEHSEHGPAARNQDFFGFMEALVSHFQGRVQAYEVWNEQNLRREWSTGRPLSAAEYVELLRGAYQVVKKIDPAAIVVSGAPSPTGWNDGVVAIDDALYLEQMHQAGLTRWCDAIGAHGATGSNIPPDARIPGYEDFSACFRGPWDSPHHSWTFSDLMQKYYQIMSRYGDGQRKIWVTEFGWAVEENPPPDRLYAADNTREEQIAWTIRAYQLARSWGFVGPVFLWNLNFPTGEQAMWRIEGTQTYSELSAARRDGRLP